MKTSSLKILLLVLILQLPMNLCVYGQCANPDDYSALRALYLSTDGDNWIRKAGWPNKAYFLVNQIPAFNVNLSNWQGVSCLSGRVSKVELSSNNLNGRIPKEVVKLKDLQILKLNYNNLYGNISSEIGNLTKLSNLNLSFNILNGTIPITLSNLKTNCLIDLNNNRLNGCFPSSLKKFCGNNFSCYNNKLLPWSGNFINFCATDGSEQMQIGQECDNGFVDDGKVDLIRFNCQCGQLSCENSNLKPINNSCSSATHLGSALSTINVAGDNTCANTGGLCGSNSESSVYYVYTVPSGGVTLLRANVDAPHIVSISLACGFGGCSNEEFIYSPIQGANYYITVSSPKDAEGPFNLFFTAETKTPPISGVVYIDLNANGIFDNTDVGLQSTPIELLKGCPGGKQVATTITAYDGTYTFKNIPSGSYTVQKQSDAPGAPSGDPSPNNCCLDVDSGMPNAVLECYMGYPPPDCSSNPYSVDNICETAYDNPLCNLTVIGDFACGQNPSEIGPWSPQAHCAGIYDNTSFYGFVAGSGSYQIQFTIFACAGTGVQYGLMDVCSPGGPYIVCNGSANTGTVIVDASSLEPCKTYVFWIDGFSGSVCSYYIQVTGDFNVCEIPPITDLIIDSECDPLCPALGTTFLVTAVGLTGFPILENIKGVNLLWDITYPDGSIINITSPPNDSLMVNVPFPTAGEYEICVRTSHPCPGISDPFCKKFVFKDLPDTFKEFKICAADLPWSGEIDSITGAPVLDIHGNQWSWSGGDISLASIGTTPPTFNFSSQLTNKCGCNYTQNIQMAELGLGFESFNICAKDLPFVYNDTVINESVSNLTFIVKNTIDGCDSLVLFTLNVFEVGDTCDDQDPKTINDKIQEDCNCKGEIDSQTSDEDQYLEIKVMPNPSNGLFNIYGCDINDITIHSLDGRTVSTTVFYKDAAILLDLNSNPSGTYLLKVKHKNGKIIKKLVKL